MREREREKEGKGNERQREEGERDGERRERKMEREISCSSHIKDLYHTPRTKLVMYKEAFTPALILQGSVSDIGQLAVSNLHQHHTTDSK